MCAKLLFTCQEEDGILKVFEQKELVAVFGSLRGEWVELHINILSVAMGYGMDNRWCSVKAGRLNLYPYLTKVFGEEYKL
jgi:hypothetical protein